MLDRRSAIALVSICVIAACSAGRTGGVIRGTDDGEGGAGSVAAGTGGAGGKGGSQSTADVGTFVGSTVGSGGGGVNCNSGMNDDADKDGYTPAQGDCNDCDANANPGAIEVLTPVGVGGGGGAPPSPSDEDCDGLVDAMDPDTQPCDTGLAVDDPDPKSGAKALDICHFAMNPQDWGVIDAKWVLPDGSPPPANANFDLGHGILSAFGTNVNVQWGTRMLGVSSGAARQPSDPGYQDVGGFSKGINCTHPVGFPKESPSCGVAVTGGCFDGAGLEIALRAPTNAHGFSFNFNFFTYEWPGYVCSTFNDFFTALLTFGPPPGMFPPGQQDGNITFDNIGNPVSVNNAFVDVCGCAGGPPCTAGGKVFTCGLGTAALLQTGFGADTAFADHGSTYWLKTQAPVDPGALFTLRFAAYDSGDGVLDSTALVDNFQWIAEPGITIGTEPVPEPL